MGRTEKLYHPETNRYATVIAAFVPVHLKNGWQRVGEAGPAEGEKDLEKMAAAELKNICKVRGIKYPGKANKSDLLKLLKAEGDSEPEDDAAEDEDEDDETDSDGDE